MFNLPHNNGMGTPPVNNGGQPPVNQGQAQNQFIHVMIPIFLVPRPIDQRSVEQIWELALALEEREDYRSAFREFATLASRGVTEAKFKLGQYCFLALGQPESFSRAYLAFSRAAQDGHEEAQKMVALFDQFPILKSLS